MLIETKAYIIYGSVTGRIPRYIIGIYMYKALSLMVTLQGANCDKDGDFSKALCIIETISAQIRF